MTQTFLTALILASSATVTSPQTNEDRLSEIAAFFAGVDVIAGPTVVACTLSAAMNQRAFELHFEATR